MKKQKVIRMLKEDGTYIEAGVVEKPTFKNEIYFKILSGDNGSKATTCYLKVDEALILIEILIRTLNYKITGLELKVNKLI